VAENVMDMFVQHVSGTFVRPSQRIMDVPIWLDTLVCQLMEKKPEQRPLDAETVQQALEEIQTKVEALKSAGVEAAGRTARRGKDDKERETARAIVAGSRRKKLKKKRTPWARIAQGAALLAGLVAIVLLLWFTAFRPDSPEKLLSEGIKYVQRGDKLLDEGDDFAAWQRWDTAKSKYLNKVLDLDPEGSLGQDAKQHLAHIEAGNLYLKGRKLLQEAIEKKDWKAINESKGLEHYHQVLERYAQDGELVARIRRELGDLEGPVLLEEAEKLADPAPPFPADFAKLTYVRPDSWHKAHKQLDQLQRWYPDSSAGKRGAELLSRLNAHERGLEKVLMAVRANQRPFSLDPGEREAIVAIQEELAAAVEEKASPGAKPSDETKQRIAGRWRELIELGKKLDSNMRPQRDDPEIRPWVLLAEAKLKVLDRR
jgi:hypothetical protein